MMTLQNLDVHGTFCVHRGKIIFSFHINDLTVELRGFITLAKAGLRNQSDRYRFDLYRYSHPEDAHAPMAGCLFFSEGSSAAYQQEVTQ